MSHQVVWTKMIVETFIEEAMLSQEEEMVLRTRASGMPRTEQAERLNMSISKLDKIIATLKKKYDNVAKYNPLLPPRKTSAEELWMDEH